MPTSNLAELLAAALKSGQLVVTEDAAELKPTASKHLKKHFKNILKDRTTDTVEGAVKIPFGRTGERVDNSVIDAVRMSVAHDAIKAAWDRAGGPMSKVGLPLDPKMPVREVEPGKWVADFRSGEMQYHQNTRKTIQWQKRTVTVRLVAIECQMRQESADEVYGVVAVHGPANRLFQAVRIPAGGTLTMGPTGARLTFPNIPIVEDIQVEDLYIRVAWIENDSGSADDIARKVAARLQEAAAALAGGVSGAAAEAVAQSEDETFYEAALWIVGNVLGMGDDAYPVESAYISPGKLLDGSGPPLQPPYKRPDDSRVVDRWTHEVTVQGVDGGGDVGKYRFYFEVVRKDTDVEEPE